MAIKLPNFLDNKVGKAVLITAAVFFVGWIVYNSFFKKTVVVTQPPAPKTTVSMTPSPTAGGSPTVNVTTGG